jgi:predicted  nucleic acid-binding Zn-ribbon protein
MNEDPNKIIPFSRLLEKREGVLNGKQEIIGSDIGELRKKIDELQEELALAESCDDEERIFQLKGEIKDLNDLVAKDMDRLDELDGEKKKMWSDYKTYQQEQREE